MFKLFIKVYFFILLSFVALFIVLVTLPDLLISEDTGIEIEKQIYQQAFRLLDESIKGLDSIEINDKIKEYKKIFNQVFDLVDLETLNLSKKERQLIKTTLIKKEYSNTEISFFYKQSIIPSKVWKLHSDTDFSLSLEKGLKPIVAGKSFIRGLFYLFEQQLFKYPQNQWHQIITRLKLEQGYDIALKTIKQYQLNKEEISQLKAFKIINITNGTNKITFIKRIKNSDNVLQFGSITIPWMIYYLVIIMLGAFAVFISILSLIWVWPLWRDLSKIKRAALDFGAGYYATRIPTAKFSSLNMISHAFNHMAEKTQRSINSHTELTNAVSHELRTPVARMRFSLEMLLSTKNKQDKERYIDDITQDIDELDLLLAELLTYARFDSDHHQMIMQSELLSDWFNQAMQRLTLLSNHKAFHYVIKGIVADQYALFEPRLMTRVVDNLVLNAFHYAKQRVKVTLTVEDKYYKLIVEDDGFGIPESEYHRIFDAFSRIDQSRDRDSGGFGLGLAIVKRIVEGHQGDVLIKRSNLGGALFEVKWLR